MPDLCVKKNGEVHRYPFISGELEPDLAQKYMLYKSGGKIYSLPMTDRKNTGYDGVLAVKIDSKVYFPVARLHYELVKSMYFKTYSFNELFNTLKPYFPSSGTTRFIIPRRLDGYYSVTYPYTWYEDLLAPIPKGLVAIRLEWSEFTSNFNTSLLNKKITFCGVSMVKSLLWNNPDSWGYEKEFTDGTFEFDVGFDVR